MLVLALCAAARATTLEEAWSAAESADVQLRIAQETAVQQGTLRAKAWSALSPRLSGHAAYVINNQEILLDMTATLPPELAPLVGDVEPVVVQKKTFWQGDVTASMRVFSASAFSGLRAAYALTDAAREDVRDARARSKVSVASAYYGVLTARRAVEVAQEGVSLANAQLELAQKLLEAGIGDDRAVVQARLGVSQASRDLRSAQAGVVEAESGFALLTGLEGAELQLPEPFPVPPDAEAAVARARTNRPDLAALDDRVRAARQSQLGQGLTWLPVVDLVGAYNYTQNTGLATPDPWTWRVVAQATWDLWDGGLRLANQREAASQVRAIELGRSLAGDSAEREVRLAYEAHARAQAALDAVLDERALAEESLRMAETGYGAGRTAWIEVQGARLQLQATDLAILRERMSRDLAAIELLQRVGEL